MVKISDKEKERFREYTNQFSREQLLGWLTAISFILPMNEVDTKLRDKLVMMFDICDDVINEKDYPR